MTVREEFLQKMYEQMFRDIAQQLNTVWQSVATLFGSFAIIALSEKGVVSVDFGVTIVIILCAWFVSSTNECSYWYNRNLAIIANIERQFLKVSDLKEVHYYFGAHRPKNKMIAQLKIQVALSVALLGVIILYHLSLRVLPGLGSPLSQFEPIRVLPYVGLIGLGVWVRWIVKSRNEAYEEFLQNSPGKTVDVAGIQYGIGHGH